MEFIGYPYVAMAILAYLASAILGTFIIGVGVARVGQCMWHKITGKASFSGCLFSTADPTET